MSGDLPRRYTDLSDWYPLITHPDEYEEEASFYTDTLLEHGIPSGAMLLELGSGSGANAFHYKTHFTPTLTDISPQMLDLSKKSNPECEHILGDMRTLRLNRTFDAVFVHDAICYMRTREDLRAAIETAFVHLRSGGIALFAPDEFKETFEDAISTGGRDEGHRALRFIAWSSDPNRDDSNYTYEFVYLLHEVGQSPQALHEVHECGLFSRHEWMALMVATGFEAEVVSYAHSEVPRPLEVIVAKKPGEDPD